MWNINGITRPEWVFEQGTIFRPPVTVRNEPIVIPGQHGATYSGKVKFAEPQITLQLFMSGNVDELAADLMALLTSPGLTIGQTRAGVAVSAAARLVSVTVAGSGRGWIRYTIVLSLPGVFLRGAATTIPAQSIPGTGLQLASLNNSTAPCTDAIIQIRGPVTSVQITDPVSGTGISWAGSLAANRYLYLDVGTLAAWNATGANAWTPSGTDVTAGINYPAAGVLEIWPTLDGQGQRRASVDVTCAGQSAATTITARAIPAYL